MNLSSPENLAVVDHLLTTTRAVRKRLDFARPVEREIIERCIEIAIQAPTGSNVQNWHFVVVTDASKRFAIAEFYRKAFYPYIKMAAKAGARNPRTTAEQMGRVADSATYLADHLHEAPVFIIPCFEGRVESGLLVNQASSYGSLLPAVWSLMLALRARGLGAAWTTLHLMFESDVAKILGIPDSVTQAALLPVAYFTGGDFKPAERYPAQKVTHWDAW
jgi:nitroreductase